MRRTVRPEGGIFEGGLMYTFAVLAIIALAVVIAVFGGLKMLKPSMRVAPRQMPRASGEKVSSTYVGRADEPKNTDLRDRNPR